MCVCIDSSGRTQLKLESLSLLAFAELRAIAQALLIVKPMLSLGFYDFDWIWLECRITINMREDDDLCVGAFLDQIAEFRCIRRTPIHSEVNSAESLQL